MLGRAALTIGLFAIGACAAESEAATAGGGDEGALEFRGAPAVVDDSMPDVDSIGYELDLTVTDATPGREAFRARTRGTFVATRELRELRLDFEGNEVGSVQAGEGELAPARHTREGDILTVALPQRVARGRAFVVEIEYEGRFVQADGANPNDFASFGGLMVRQENAEGRRIFASLAWPSKARRFMPLRDHPRDGAMIAMSLTFPSSFEVRANGVRKDVRAAGANKTWRYEALTPMPTYDFHIAAYEGWARGERRASSGVTISSELYPRHRAAGETVVADLPRAMDYFESTYGAYRFGPTATFLEVPIFGGGMEHASVVSLDETLFDDPRSARQTAFHELAHHWSGNLVRIASWSDFWLSEGFTDYLTGRVVDAIDGPEAGRAVWASFAERAFAEDGSHPLRPNQRTATEVDVLSIFDSVSYQKGARVLRMLESVVGERELTGFLAKWFSDHAHASVTTMDFERELSAFTDRDLAAFFDQFVYATGIPEVSAKLTASTIALESTIATDVPVDALIADDQREERIQLSRSPKPLPFTPTRITLDPDDRLYAQPRCDALQQCKPHFRCSRSRCVP